MSNQEIHPFISVIALAWRTFTQALAGILMFFTFPIWLIIRFRHEIAISICFLVPLLTYSHQDPTSIFVRFPPIIIWSIVIIGVLVTSRYHMMSEIWRYERGLITVYVLVIFTDWLIMIYFSNWEAISHPISRISFFIIMWAVASGIYSERLLKRSLSAFLLGVFILSLLTILQALRITDFPFADQYRPARTFLGLTFPLPRTLGIRMSYGEFGILTSFALSIWLALHNSNIKIFYSRFMRLSLGGIILFAIMIAQARGIYLTIGMVIVLTIGLVRIRFGSNKLKFIKERFILIFGIIVLFFVLVFFSLFNPNLGPLMDLDAPNSEVNIVARGNMNVIAVRLWFESPIVGIGFGKFGNLAYELTGSGTGLHNHFLSRLLHTGLIGFIPYVIFYIFVIHRAYLLIWHSRSDLLRTAGIALFVGMIGTILELMIFEGIFVESSAVIIGLTISASILNRKLEIGEINSSTPLERPA